VTRHSIARASHAPTLTHDLEALVLAVGILTVVLALCLVSAIWPEAI
jgi:hypothetical protein